MMTSPTWALIGVPLSYFPHLRVNYYLLDVINPRQYSHTSVVENGELLRDLLLRRREISWHFSNNFSFFTSLTQTTWRMGSAFPKGLLENCFLGLCLFYSFRRYTRIMMWNVIYNYSFSLFLRIFICSFFRNDIQNGCVLIPLLY